MCGIVGFITTVGDPAARIGPLEAMASCLEHRGPDDAGTWVSPDGQIALGHRRLSIIDVSSGGHQPMVSADGRFVVVYNGEMYNFRRVRSDLQATGRRFRTGSDTEVLLEAVAEWGVAGALRRMVGMFAFALVDRATRTVHLARDRMGEKPLYYGRVGAHVAFASELKALRHLPGWEDMIDRGALAGLLRFGYVPTPATIFEGVSKLPPGSVLSLAVDHLIPTRLPAPEPYWSVAAEAAAGQANPFRGSDAEAADALDALLGEAVGGSLEADVPLGVLLSGGVDSSTVAGVAQAQSSRTVRTYSIGFDDVRYDEAAHARAVARHLGTEHTELVMSAADALDVIPRLPTVYDEPFADVSQIPTLVVSALARRHVTVALSGDGGDELFGGYTRYAWGPRLWDRMRRVPLPLRRAVGGGMRALSPAAWDALCGALGPVLPAALRQRSAGENVHKISRMLGAGDPDALYDVLTGMWDAPSALVVGAPREGRWGLPHADGGATPALAERMMLGDMLGYLPDDILVKVDRASMAASLESRAPLLDYRLVEFAWRLPLHLKVRDGVGKWLLRQVLYRYVPAALIERPKMGFAVPIHAWLRGPLRDWAEALLDPARLRREGFLQAEPIRRAWTDHLAGRRNVQYPLWTVLMFQAWLETWRRR